MGFNCGILGLPNVGKSTLFNALTSTQSAESANYPFCTIEPNVGKVSLNDARLKKISNISKSEKTIFSQVEFVDIAGLVKGASKGEGLGNKFLSNLNSVDALIHVIRCFENTEITHIENTINPKRDLEIIETELILSDISKTEKFYQNYLTKNKGKKNDPKIISLFEKLIEGLSSGKLGSQIFLDNTSNGVLKELNLLTTKPMMILGNMEESQINKKNTATCELENYVLNRKQKFISVCASIEAEVSQLDSDIEKKDFLKSMNIQNSGLDKLVRNGFDLLNLISFFTSGPKESRAWSCPKGTKAPQAGGKIHSDFERGFIKAETIGYEDFIKFNGDSGCRNAGKVRLEGKDYEVKDGDIITFKFNV